MKSEDIPIEGILGGSPRTEKVWTHCTIHFNEIEVLDLQRNVFLERLVDTTLLLALVIRTNALRSCMLYPLYVSTACECGLLKQFIFHCVLETPHWKMWSGRRQRGYCTTSSINNDTVTRRISACMWMTFSRSPNSSRPITGKRCECVWMILMQGERAKRTLIMRRVGMLQTVVGIMLQVNGIDETPNE